MIFVPLQPRYFPVLSYDTTTEEREKKEGFTIFPTFLHPKSIGEIKLKSSDPLIAPSIDPHYFEDPYDVQAMIEVRIIIMTSDLITGVSGRK